MWLAVVEIETEEVAVTEVSDFCLKLSNFNSVFIYNPLPVIKLDLHYTTERPFAFQVDNNHSRQHA